MAKAADGSQAPRVLVRGFLAQYPHDGRYLVYCRSGSDGSNDIWYATAGGTDTTALIATPASESFPMPAPQGGYLLYDSNESGRAEIYLRQFPTGEGRWQVSTNGGTKGQWSRKGDRIYYTLADQIYEVDVALTPSVRLAAPRPLFNLSNLHVQTFGRYTVVPTSNPDRFLMMIKTSEQGAKSHTDAIVVENWPAEFGKKQ